MNKLHVKNMGGLQCWRVIGLVVGTVLLASCGGGGGGSPTAVTPTPIPTPTTITITGVVAKGAVLANAAIAAKCANAQTYTAVSSATGAYALEVPASAAPCMIQATGQDGTVWRTVAVGGGNASITPITEMVVAKLVKALPGEAFATYPNAATVALLTPANVATAQSDVRTALNGISDLSVIPDFIATPFKAATATTAGDAIDQAIDALTASLKAKGSSTQAVAGALAQGKAVSSTFGTASTIRAAQIPTTGYTSAEGLLTPGFRQIGDVWAVPGTVVVNGDSGAGTGGLAVSEDNGATWTGLPQVVYYPGRTAIGPGVILSGGGSGTLSRHVRRQAGGWTTESLKLVDPQLGSPFIESLVYFGSGYIALVTENAYDASVYKSTDGRSWVKQGYGFKTGCNLRSMLRTADGTLKLCDKVSKDDGATWTSQPDPFGYDNQHLLVGGTEVVISRGQALVWQSSDNGGTFSPVSSNLYSLVGTGNVMHLAVVGSDIVVVYMDQARETTHIARSSDKGKTWVASEAGFAGSGLFTSEKQQSMSVVGNDVYLSAATSGNQQGFGSFLYQSHDGGKNWFIALKAEYWRPTDLWSQGGQCYRQDYWVGPSANYHWRTESSSDGLNWTQIAADLLPRALDDKGTRLRQVVTSVPPPGGSGSWILDHTTVEKYDQNTGSWRTVLKASAATVATNPWAADGALYVGFSSIGQIFKSADMGETWQQVTGLSVPTLATDIRSLGNRTLLAVNTPKPCIGSCTDAGYKEGVFISKDDGATWKQIPEFGVPRSVAVGNGVVVGSRAYGSPGLVKMSPPYASATVTEPSFGATSDSSYKTVLFEENTFWFSDTGGKLRVSTDGANTWQAAQLDVTEAISGVAVCGHRLVLNTSGNLLASPATLP